LTCSTDCIDRVRHEPVSWHDQRPAQLRPMAAVIQYEKRPVRFWQATNSQLSANPLNRLLSVEIECDKIKLDANGTPLRNVLAKWSDSVVSDGSLGGTMAHEICTSPSSGDLFLSHMQEICDEYKLLHAGCTAACGLHVHVDARDLKFYELRKVILLYARTEQALFELCAPCRLNARYSQVCGANYANMSPYPSEFKRQLLTKFYGGQDAPLWSSQPSKERAKSLTKSKSQKYIPIRYRALNLHSWFMRQSIEFRHHEGTVNYETIVNWALICGNLIEAANKLSEHSIRNLHKNSRQALLEVLPGNLQDYCKAKWADVESIDWTKFSGGGDLPNIPPEERQLDKISMKRLRRKERQRKAQLDKFRLAALTAIINNVPLPDTGPETPVPNPTQNQVRTPIQNPIQNPIRPPGGPRISYTYYTNSVNLNRPDLETLRNEPDEEETGN
jgi:Putative amidoligase enzyme